MKFETDFLYGVLEDLNNQLNYQKNIEQDQSKIDFFTNAIADIQNQIDNPDSPSMFKLKILHEVCECGGSYKHSGKKQHVKSVRHQKMLLAKKNKSNA